MLICAFIGLPFCYVPDFLFGALVLATTFKRKLMLQWTEPPEEQEVKMGIKTLVESWLKWQNSDVYICSHNVYSTYLNLLEWIPSSLRKTFIIISSISICWKRGVQYSPTVLLTFSPFTFCSMLTLCPPPELDVTPVFCPMTSLQRGNSVSMLRLSCAMVLNWEFDEIWWASWHFLQSGSPCNECKMLHV